MKPPSTGFLRRIGPVVFLVAASVFAWAPLLNPGYFFSAHDAPHSVFFLVEFDQTLRDGFLWPRWAPDFAFGYGYPLFNIYAPLAFFAAEAWHLLGVSFVSSVKIVYVLATVGGGLAMFGFVNRVYGRTSGVLAGVIYVYAPFHLVEIFVRCAFPEYVALALLPLVLWTFFSLVDRPTPKRVGLAGLTLGLLALTHHASLLSFSPLLGLYILFLGAAKWRRQGWRAAWRASWPAGLACVLGAVLGAVYLLPLVAEAGFVKVSQWTSFNYAFQNHFVYPAQFVSPFWGFGYSGAGLEDGMPFQLGVVPLVLAFAAIVALLSVSERGMPDSEQISVLSPRSVTWFFLGTLVAVVWLMTPAAAPAWADTPLVSLVQFPWRLLGLAVVAMAVVAGAVLHTAQARAAHRLDSAQEDGKGPDSSNSAGVAVPGEAHLLVLVVVLGSFAYLRVQNTEIEPWRETPRAVVEWDRFSPADRVAMVAYTDEQPTTSPMESQYLSGVPLQVAAVVTGDGSVETVRHGGASDEVLVQANGPVTVQFFTYEFPGWQVLLDGRLVEHRAGPPHGLVTLDVPEGEHRLLLKMGSTPPRLIGGVLSIVGFIGLSACLVGGTIWSRLSHLL